ncbi:hypothetical protein PMM47T1_16915 [Pseudomonas sp. M47T1]|uniref:hypothetical protein n=1 Tax=unclassified Pseudomonas TaxID=196821 RepID=UPI0002608AE6|nr:hypothetical protein [Pseudomonas sp. M47T1]EIK95490.1 hypothetical protein PMM47T1_16915 [Pseudomonas sp. M47T1]
MTCWRALIVVLTLLLTACAGHRPLPAAPVSAATWQQVDGQILQASSDAREQARVFARGSMDHWRVRVYQQTEEVFIPWFDSYWTQEWLSMRVSWYTLSSGQDKTESARRLEAYLQEQYHNRVLAPVAVDIEPNAIAVQATDFYVQLLGAQLAAIGQQHQLPANQYAQHLQGIVVLGTATLQQITHTQPPTQVPDYAALVQRLHAGDQAAPAGLAEVAKATNSKLQGQMSSRGAGGFAAAVAGKIVGPLISLGMAGVRAIIHAGERPDSEALLRKSLGTAFDQAWLKVLSDPNGGVMAGVYRLADSLEVQLAARTVSQRLDKASSWAQEDFWQHGATLASGSNHGL